MQYIMNSRLANPASLNSLDSSVSKSTESKSKTFGGQRIRELEMGIKNTCPATNCCFDALLETHIKKWLSKWTNVNKYWTYFLFLLTILSGILSVYFQTGTLNWITGKSNGGQRERMFQANFVQTQKLARLEESCYLIVHNWGANVLESRGKPRNNYSPDDDDLKYLEIVQNYLADYEDSTGKWSQNKAEIVPGNPIAVYRMMRRFTQLLEPLRTEKFPSKSFQEFAQSLTKTIGWPRKIQLYHFIVRILKLQHAHDLKARHIANGKWGSVQTNVKINSKQCYEFGLTAYKQRFYNLAVEWLELGSKKSRLDDDNKMLILIDKTLDRVVEKYNNSWDTERTEYHFREKIQPFVNSFSRISMKRKGKNQNQFNLMSNFWTSSSLLTTNGSVISLNF